MREMRNMREFCLPLLPLVARGEIGETDDCVRDDINESALILARVQG